MVMGNDVSCKLVGIDTIRIKLFDGIVKILEIMKHIPNLKRNLILLNTLVSKGYKYISEGRALRVSNVPLRWLKDKKGPWIH